MERGLTLSTADVSLLVLTVALAIFAALVIPAHPYFGTDTDAELAAQDWARQASLNSTQPVREQLSKVVSDAIAASSTAEIGRAASIAALVMASLHAASSWSTLEPWLRSKVVMFVALTASVAVFSAMPTAQSVTAVPFEQGTCLVAEIEPVMSFCYTVLAAVYVGAAYNDHTEWATAPAVKSRGWSWCRVSDSLRGGWRRFALGVAIHTVCFILILAAGVAQATSAFAFIARGIGTSVAIPPLFGVAWTVRRACKSPRRFRLGCWPCCIPRDSAVTLLQHSMPMVAFSVVCIAYVASAPQQEGCPDFLKAGRDLESPFSLVPAGTRWPEGFDPTNEAARRGVVRTLTDTAVLRLLAACISVTTSVVIILQAQDSTARLREREGQAASETLRRAIGFVSHGARGPLNAAVLSLALLRQVNDKQPLAAGTEDERDGDGSAHHPTAGLDEDAGAAKARGPSERARVPGDSTPPPAGRHETRRLGQPAAEAGGDKPSGAKAAPTVECPPLGGEGPAADGDVTADGDAFGEGVGLATGSPLHTGDSNPTSVLDRASLLRELRASIQDSKRQLDGLLLWEKTKGRTAVDAVPWGWARLDKTWRSRIRLAFRGVCESTGVMLRVATLSYGPGHDMWEDAPSSAADGSPRASASAGKHTAFTSNGSPSGSGVWQPSHRLSASDMRSDGHPSPRVQPADNFSIFADHDRILGVCNNAASYGLSRVSELKQGKVELRCTVIPDADLCLRMGGPAEHPDDADLSVLEGRWAREDHLAGQGRRQGPGSSGDGSVIGSLLGLNRRGSGRTTAAADFAGSFAGTTRTTRSGLGSSGRRAASIAAGSVAPGHPPSVLPSVTRHEPRPSLEGPPPVLAVLQIEARDNGPGVSRRLLASGKLFQPFARLQNDDSGLQLGSTGLALAVVRAIVVDGMGGEVGLCSCAAQPARRGFDPAALREDSDPVAASEASDGFGKPQASRDGVVVFARIPVWVRPVARAAAQQEPSIGGALDSGGGSRRSEPRTDTSAGGTVRVGTAGQLSNGAFSKQPSAAASSRGAMIASEELDNDSDDGLEGLGGATTASPAPPRQLPPTVDTGALPRHFARPVEPKSVGAAGRGGSGSSVTGAAAAQAAAEASAAAAARAQRREAAAQLTADTASTPGAGGSAAAAGAGRAARGDRAARQPRRPREQRAGRLRAGDAAAGASGTPTKARPLAGLLAFLCDDDGSSRHLMARLLQRKGMRCEEFEDGRRLMNRLEGLLLSDEPLPDVMLVDGSMPVMDGPAVLHELLKLSDHQSERARSLASIPVNMVTGDDSRAAEFKRLGAQATVLKPIDATMLVTMLVDQCGVSIPE
ncbi:hypothetical protein FNF27_04225 [Cafeteria roenbergensis]|uniref:Response regulatory domain-containing protein n=1 Tax=Cafeteria roenbergensis TaxID=33653 RepID=A0A5A8E8T4_CAFRO|nr:hypothetical protein FNF27_04225 [Cafeteria roenbergensis]